MRQRVMNGTTWFVFNTNKLSTRNFRPEQKEWKTFHPLNNAWLIMISQIELFEYSLCEFFAATRVY